MAAMSSLRRPPITGGSLGKSLMFKWSLRRIRLMKKKQKKKKSEQAPSRKRRQWLRRHRPLRPCRDDLPFIQHLPRTTTLEFESDYYCCEFPQELLREILVRLPSVECIIKCTAVCKSWRSVIKSPTFIDAHLSRGLNRNQIGNGDNDDDGCLLLLGRGIRSRSYELYWDRPSAFGSDGEFFPLNIANSKSVVTPLVFESSHYWEDVIRSSDYFNLAGTCNGLLCLANDNDYWHRIPTIICNPLVRKFVALPSPSIAIPDQDGISGYNYVRQISAFGYDPQTNDYKVLRILGSSCSGPAGDVPFGVELYSLARGSWKTLSPAAFPGCFDLFLRTEQTRVSKPSHVPCNGALHWLLARDNTCKERVIVSFDVVTESFREIQMPEALRGIPRSVFLSVHEKDYLAVIDVDWQCFDVHLWVMQQYGVVDSWTKLSTVSLGDLRQYSCSSPYPYPFGFKSNGEQVFNLGYGSNFSCHRVLLKVDFKNKQVSSGLDRQSELCESMDSFVESLVVLNQSNALPY